MANEKLKQHMKDKQVAQWQLAEYFGKCENTVQRKLRTELSLEDYQKYLHAIDAIASGRKSYNG